jgi:hypothetical protein
LPDAIVNPLLINAQMEWAIFGIPKLMITATREMKYIGMPWMRASKGTDEEVNFGDT